jgi:serine/threonine-protein kinase
MLLGLHAAHETRAPGGAPLAIVHRDVSPQNVLVGEDGIARVLDFGIATAAWRLQTTRDGRLKGKFRYMAPEQIANEPVDRRVDIYAAAIVLWETLTRQRLARSDNPATILSDAQTRPHPPPSSVRSDVPPALDAIVLRGLARRPEDRFATALEMARALEHVVRPASAREIGEWVESVAGAQLRARAHKLDAIESEQSGVAAAVIGADEPTGLLAGSESAVPEYSSSYRPERRRATAARRRVAWSALALAALCAGGLIAWRVSPKPPRDLSPIEPARFAPATNDPKPPPSIAVSAAPQPPPPVAASATPKPPVRRVVPPRRPGCNPPYTFVDGMKRWKPECL